MIGRAVIVATLIVVVYGAGASCGSGRASNARQERSDVSNEPKDQLLQLSAHPGLEIRIRTGTQHWQAGEITVIVRGTGAVEVTQRQATETASFEGALSNAELDAFGRELRTHRFTDARISPLPREPGDTPAVLSLHRDGEVIFEAQLWSADRDGDADLDAILRAAEQLIHRISAGKLGRP